VEGRRKRGRPRRRNRREPSLRRAEETFLGEEEHERGIVGGEELLEGGAEELELFADERPAPIEPPPRRRRGGETARRVLFAIPWIVFAIAITVAGGLVFAIAIAGIGLIGLREYFVMTARQRPIQIAAYLAVPGMIMAAHFGSAFNVLLVATASFLLLFAFGADRSHRDGITVSMGVTLLGVVWIGLPLVHAVLLRDLPNHGAALLIDVLVGTFVTDTAAYATGRMFGQHRFAPGLSQDWLSGVDALIIGAAVAALAPLGDLFESMLKRDLGRKDTGTLFGPHGGLLDRLDAVFFTIVVGYYLSVQLVY
jgi:phosphatidate cytidylyltransferase